VVSASCGYSLRNTICVCMYSIPSLCKWASVVSHDGGARTGGTCVHGLLLSSLVECRACGVRREPKAHVGGTLRAHSQRRTMDDLVGVKRRECRGSSV
jgi:hypothetical protein